jgi:3-carboxy-cis,cis-muconate cycloisomerase
MPAAPPFSLLIHLAGDPVQQQIFSADAAIESWLAAERALALAQAEHGVLPRADAEAIARAAVRQNIDVEALWTSARGVGYPILGLVRAIASTLPSGPDGRVHFGATTQDIMDTGLALQLDRSLGALDDALRRLGDRLAERVAEHVTTVMAARTHGQQAVPTTFGATLSTLLAQFGRHRRRLAEARPRIAVISMFGAGGTSAAYGPRSAEVRATASRLLGLGGTDIPWHVDRDGVAEFGYLCVGITAACARFARNVIDLSRTEIGEVFEPYASHRGASSTMPQKVNPISSEAVVGFAGTAGALASALARIPEAGHERAAGEWQIEWNVLPQLAHLAGSALAESYPIVDGMRVDAARMRANLELDGGLVMAEAVMMDLAATLGRERAHDVLYETAERARRDGTTLDDALSPELRDAHPRRSPDDYLGEARRMCRVAIETWRQGPAPWPHLPLLRDLATPEP